MAAVSDPVPIHRTSKDSGSSGNLSNTPTAIEPATPLLGATNMAALESIPKHKGENDFRTLFDLPNATLLDDFSAALQLKSLLLHGRFYISSSAICFYSGVFGRKTSKVIRYDQIIGLYKRNTAKLFPNAIEVVTVSHKYFFCSFMFRDAAFRLASTAWSDYLEASPSADTHRINVNNKFDLELYVRKPSGDEQVKMISAEMEDSLEQSESGTGTSPASTNSIQDEDKKGAAANKPPGKLGDSGKGSTTSIATPPPSSNVSAMFAAAGVVESSEDADANGSTDASDRKGKKRKQSSSNKKRDVTSSAPAGRNSDGEESEDRQAASPTHSRHGGVVVSAPTKAASVDLKAKAVGFDLRAAPGSSDALVTSSAGGAANGGGAASNGGDADGEPRGSPVPERRSNGVAGGSTSSADVGALAEESAPAVEPAPLPEVPIPIPTSLTCKHVLEEADDKKYTGTKLGAQKIFKNLTLNAFFALIWGNPEFGTLLQKEMDYTEWNSPAWAMNESNCCLQRMISYRMPLKSGLGPKSTRVDSYQNVRFKHNNCLLFESSNISKDVPLSDAFEVHEKWVLQQEGTNVIVDVTAGVVWKKSAWGLKGTINSKSVEGATEAFEHVSKLLDQIIDKYNADNAAYIQQASGDKRSGSANAVASTHHKKKHAAAEEEEESSSEDERKSSRKRKHRSRKDSRASDARDNSNENIAVPAAEPAPTGVLSGLLSGDWKTTIVLAVLVFGLAALCALFFSTAQISARLANIEGARPYTPSHEENNLRERVAFLEHLTTGLLHNISHPGSYKSDQQRYWMALRDLDGFLSKTRENVHTLQTTVHEVYSHRDQPSLSSSTVLDALRTLPIDRKVLNYLMNPDGFAQRLSAVLKSPTDEFLQNVAETTLQAGTVAASEGGFMWIFYYLMVLGLIAIVGLAIARVMGVKILF